MDDNEFQKNLLALASTSEEAAALAQSIVNEGKVEVEMVSVSKSYLVELQTTIRQQAERLRNLTETNVDDVALSEVEGKEIYELSYKDVKAQPFAILYNTYSVKYLQQYPPSVRKLMATALVNVCTERNNTPRPFWLSASIGVLND